MWCKLEDHNTKFFHLTATNRARRNFIGSLSTGDGTVTDHADIRQIILDHYHTMFSEESFQRPSLLSDKFLKITNVEADQLESPFSFDEVKAAIWSCDRSKSPGLDGFNFNFFKVA